MDEQILIWISKQLEEIHTMLVRQQQGEETGGKMGRPNKRHLVMQYRRCYPKGKKMECVKLMGISIKTVSKYWDSYADFQES